MFYSIKKNVSIFSLCAFFTRGAMFAFKSVGFDTKYLRAFKRKITNRFYNKIIINTLPFSQRNKQNRQRKALQLFMVTFFVIFLTLNVDLFCCKHSCHTA